MKDSTKKYLIIGGSILAIGGVVYYFYNKSKKKRLAEEEKKRLEEEEAAKLLLQQAQQAPTGNFGVSEGATLSSSVPAELNTTDKIKSFQDWMDTVGNWVKDSSGKYVKLNKGAGYGNFGPSTKSAWTTYGKKYLNSLTQSSDYDQVKKNVKEAQEKKSGDGTTYLAVPLSNNRFIELYKNGRFWFNQFVPVGGMIVPKNISKGDYSNAGRKMTITEGSGKGTSVETSSFWTTVAKLK
jgi:cbb3-type cytochrome oxidase subunit 3